MELDGIAKRLSCLKAKSLAEAGLLTYPIGAVFCASEAKRCGFADRINHPNRWSVELSEALSAARQLAVRRRPATSTWLSVVHFNSALHRIDAGYERVVKYVSGCNSSNFEDLARAARNARIPATTIALWRKIRKQEVNRLKHEIGGALSGQRISFQDMLKSLDDLVYVLEVHL